MPETPSIAVVGAAGYVGRTFLDDLERRGLRATAVVRGIPELFFDGTFHEIRHPHDLAGRHFDIVVNLAFPTSLHPEQLPALNADLASAVGGLLAPQAHLVHVSTQAVFGLALDRPIEVGPVATVRDAPYVEVKIAGEHAFEAMQRDRRLSVDIVRLGNVFGPASATWGVSLVQRLLTGRAIGISGEASGFSNVTDVANAASYLAHLVAVDDRNPETRYHHVAEFSDVPWSRWTDAIARAMGVVPVLAAPSALAGPDTTLGEIKAAMAPVGPKPIWRRVSQERTLGSWSRALRRRVPRAFPGPDVIKPIHAPVPSVSSQDRSFLAIMAARQQFRSSVRPDWTPALDQEGSVGRFLDWLAA